MSDKTLSECLALIENMPHGSEQKWTDALRPMYTMVLRPLTDEQGMAACRQMVITEQWRPSPAKIRRIALELISPCPSADEAWGKMPRSESETVVWTEEMAQAMNAAQPLLDEGDQIAARRAFIDTYNRLVEQMRAEGRAPVWSVSLGWDAEGRTAPIKEAVAQGLIGRDSLALLSAPVAIEGMKQIGPGEGISFSEAKKRGLIGPETLKQIAASKSIEDRMEKVK